MKHTNAVLQNLILHVRLKFLQLNGNEQDIVDIHTCRLLCTLRQMTLHRILTPAVLIKNAINES
jgi:hypothetical protein